MNLKTRSEKFGKVVFILTIIIFLWINLFGLFNYMSQMGSKVVSGCLFNGQTKACTMSFSEHVALWQGTIRSLPPITGFLNLFILLIALKILSYFSNNFSFKFWNKTIFYWKFYLKQHPQMRLFSFLLRIFSKGILHPKIYGWAII